MVVSCAGLYGEWGRNWPEHCVALRPCFRRGFAAVMERRLTFVLSFWNCRRGTGRPSGQWRFLNELRWFASFSGRNADSGPRGSEPVRFVRSGSCDPARDRRTGKSSYACAHAATRDRDAPIARDAGRNARHASLNRHPVSAGAATRRNPNTCTGDGSQGASS